VISAWSPFLNAGEVYSALTAVAWSVAVILFRRSGERIPPFGLNVFKGVVGMVLFLLTFVVLGDPAVPPGITALDALLLAGSGVVGIGIADTLFFASLNRLGAGRSAIVDCLYSPAVVACSAIFLTEPAGPLLLASMACMAVAILVGTWEPSSSGTERPAALRAGLVIGALSMVLMAVGIVWAKPIIDRAPPLWSATVRLAGGLGFLGLQAILHPRSRAEAVAALRPGPHWRVALPAAVIGTYMALLLWIAGMKYTYTNVASVLNQSSNVLVVVLAAIFLHERLTVRKVVAVLLGAVATLLAVW
jgi:drug/metabolite transporter (DMT)-like permease